MKKTVFFLAALLAVAAGCTREFDTVLPEEEGQVMVFHATAETPETKVGYTGDKTFYWSYGDQIGILSSNNGQPVWNVATYQGYDADARGVFTTGAFHSTTQFLGVAQYPAALESTAGDTFNEKTFKLGLPWQYNVETVASVFMPLIAKVYDEHASDLYFRHVGGAVKVTFMNIPESRIKTFRLLSDKRINGEFTLDLSKLGTNQCVAKAATAQNEDQKMVEIKNFSSGARQQMVVYFPVPTGSMKFGLQVLMDGKEYYYQEVGSTVNTIGRGTILQMPTVNLINNVGPVFIGNVHFSTIQEAVNAATNGQTISVNPGVYEENVVIENKNLTIQAVNTNGQSGVTVSSIEIIRAAVNLYDLTIKPSGNFKPQRSCNLSGPFGILVHFPGYGVNAGGVTIDLSDPDSNPVGIYLGRGADNQVGTKRDSFGGCTIKGSGKALVECYGGVADFTDNTFQGGNADYAVRVGALNTNTEIPNNVSFSGNKFTGESNAGIDFYYLSKSTITIGANDIDNNEFKGYTYPYHANTNVTLEEKENTFIPGAAYAKETGEVTIVLPEPVAYIDQEGYATVAKAVNAATAGQTVLVKEGTFEEDIVLNKAITLQGSGENTVLNSVSITGGAATVKDLSLKPVSTAFGVSIAHSGNGVTLENLTFDLSTQGVTGVQIGAKGSGKTADMIVDNSFACAGNVAMDITGAIAEIRTNVIENPAAAYAIRISGTGNQILLSGNDFSSVGTTSVNFHNMTGSDITFGDGQDDTNSADGTLYNGSGTTLSATDNVFTPAGYFDDENNNVFVFGKKLALTLKVDLVWGLYSEGTAWNETFGGTSGTDRSIAMDDSYIYLPETSDQEKKIWAISLTDHSAATIPTESVKSEGLYYLSGARMFDGTLAVCNIVGADINPMVYLYKNGINAEPEAIELKIEDHKPSRIGDSFSTFGALSSGFIMMGSDEGLHVWKMSTNVSGSLGWKGMFQLENVPDFYTYNPYPGDINNGMIVSRSGEGMYVKPANNKKFTSLDKSVLSMTTTASSSSSAVAVQFFTFNDNRYVAYAVQDSDAEGYLCIKKGSANSDWASILENGTEVTEPLAIHSDKNTGSSDNEAMDVAVYEAGDEVYIACLKQGVGLSLFKLYETME